VLAATVLLGACSPVLDWRQVRPEGWSLTVSMPCRPDTHARKLALAGVPVELSLLSCRADDHTFAIASAEMVDPTQVGPALQALSAAAQANLQGTVERELPASVMGMTPHPAARQRLIRGQLPDGQAVREQVLVFSHGMRVFQATLVGPQADDGRAKLFFEAIEVVP
jgi:hypothetical protein